MTLSILIVNWRSRDFVQKCLHTIQSTCSSLAPQVVVVDSGSFDGCDEMIERSFPKVEFLQSQENRGFGQANNLGFSKVTGEALLLLNPDTELQEGAVSTLLEQLQQLPDAGLLGARLLNPGGSLQVSCVQALPTPLNQALDSELLRGLFPNSSLWGTRAAFSSLRPVEVEAVSGACILMRSETFRQVGGFSSEYFMYGEDMDLCWRVRRLGRKIFHIPTAEVVHHGGGSTTGEFSSFSAVAMRHSVHLFIRKSQGHGAALTYRVLMAGSSLARIALLALAYAASQASRKGAVQDSLRKWAAVLQWSLGFEKSIEAVHAF